MDFGIRELLMLIGALILIGVIVDGVRRFQANRKKNIKVAVKRKKNVASEEDNEDELDWYSAELPGGKARVKNEKSLGLEDSDEVYEKKLRPRFDEPIDILMEGNTAQQSHANSQHTADENYFEDEEQDTYVNDDYQQNYDQVLAHEQEPQPVTSFTAKKSNIVNDKNALDDVEGIIGSPKVRARMDNENEAQKKQTQGSRFVSKKSSINQGELFVADEDDGDEDNDPSQQLPEEILSVNVIAKRGQEISGQALLDAVQTFGLRFGDMDIFHRHEHSTGQGPVIFSMANAINPGTFDIETLSESDIKGVTFFMRLSVVNKRIFVLELMVDIAKRLANQLGAELKDDTHSVLSSQTVTHYKSRIQEYERRYLGQVLRK